MTGSCDMPKAEGFIVEGFVVMMVELLLYVEHQ
jgi:hypothetical protein